MVASVPSTSGAAQDGGASGRVLDLLNNLSRKSSQEDNQISHQMQTLHSIFKPRGQNGAVDNKD